ncbi:MAG: heme o synthase [Dehalococcoidia bacterium]
MGAIEAGLRRESSLADTLGAYLALTKPRIISLLLITTIPTMILAADGVPSLWLMLATVVGGTLAAGGANAINCYFDRDIDELMPRTQGRPLPMGRIEPAHAMVFALALEVAAFGLLAMSANVLAASLALGAAAFYVFVYTLWLKRTTPQNIVIGGAAGAVPPLVAWAAVTGEVGLPAVVLFAVIFLWTPPHFWALAIKYREEYARAAVPMLPVVATPEETRTQIFLYAALLLPMSLLLVATSDASWVYGAAAVVLGAAFLWRTWELRGDDRPAAAMGVFRFSIYYLALLFVAVAADRLLLT